MTNEEMERTMRFILEQQATFAADIQQLKEAQVRFQTQLDRLGDAVLGLVGLVERSMIAQERADAKIAELAKSQALTDRRLDALVSLQIQAEERQREAEERQRQAEERHQQISQQLTEMITAITRRQERSEKELAEFRALIERYIRESRNRRS